MSKEWLLIHEQGLHHMPVVSGSKLTGLVTSTDLIRYLREPYQ